MNDKTITYKGRRLRVSWEEKDFDVDNYGQCIPNHSEESDIVAELVMLINPRNIGDIIFATKIVYIPTHYEEFQIIEDAELSLESVIEESYNFTDINFNDTVISYTEDYMNSKGFKCDSIEGLLKGLK